MEQHPYGIRVTTVLAYEEAIAAVTAALKQEGFGVLTTIDVQATLKQKLGVEHPPYTILGTCNPQLAYQALSAEPEIGLLLPCNLIVYVNPGGQTVVSVVDPQALFASVGHDRLAWIATEAEPRLRRALEALPQGT